MLEGRGYIEGRGYAGACAVRGERGLPRRDGRGVSAGRGGAWGPAGGGGRPGPAGGAREGARGLERCWGDSGVSGGGPAATRGGQIEAPGGLRGVPRVRGGSAGQLGRVGTCGGGRAPGAAEAGGRWQCGTAGRGLLRRPRRVPVPAASAAIGLPAAGGPPRPLLAPGAAGCVAMGGFGLEVGRGAPTGGVERPAGYGCGLGRGLGGKDRPAGGCVSLFTPWDAELCQA